MNAFTKMDRETFHRFAAEHPEQRFELERGRIVQQMTGGTARHGVVALMIAQQLLTQLDRTTWRVSLDRGVGIGTSCRYPDVVTEPADEPLDSLETKRPSVIIEVLSPSSAGVDLNTKPGEYFSLASLDAYIVASQSEPAMLVWVRDADGQFPESGQEISGMDQSISVKGRALAFTLVLRDIYQGICS